MIDTYIKKIAATTKRGDAREESYYPALEETIKIQKSFDELFVQVEASLLSVSL